MKKRIISAKRKIYDELLKWKRISNGKTALLIDGARRVGKRAGRAAANALKRGLKAAEAYAG